MGWPFRALMGPFVWAAAFAGIYALHGLGCARGWPARATPFGPLHETVLIAAWLAAVAATALILRTSPPPHTRESRIVRLGAWIGLSATVLTLFPVLGVSSCE